MRRSDSRIASFLHALQGIRLFYSQQNAQIHTVLAVLTIAMGAWLKITILSWLLIITMITLVMTAEALNTAIEFTVDLAAPEWQILARNAKDAAAAAVLISSIGAVLVGCLIFLPLLL